MSESISCAEVENIISSRFFERDKLISAIGCQTLVGCGKTKEIEAKFGKLQSDINDVSSNFKKSIDLLEGMKREVSGIKSLVAIDEKDLEIKMTKIGIGLKREIRLMLYGGLTLISSLLGWKIYQDFKNQYQLIGTLTPALGAIEVLKDHDKMFIDYMKEHR